MKKITCSIMAALMLLMTMPFALATTNIVGGADKNHATNLPTFGETYMSTLDAEAEQDWFKFTTQSEDAYYRIILNNINIDTDYHDDAKLNLWGLNEFDQEYAYIAAGRDTFNDCSVKLENNTTYYIKVAMGRYESENTGNYSIKIEVTNDITPDIKSEAELVALETVVQRTMDGTGDVDWYKFTTKSEDSYYRIILNNINLDTDYYDDSKLNLWGINELDQEYGYMTAGRDSSNNFSVKLENNTTYYIKVVMGDDFDEIVGNYSLKIEATNDITPDVKAEAETLPLETVVQRTMDGTGDIDWFKFTTKSEDSYYSIILNNINLDTDYYDDSKLKLWGINELDQEYGYMTAGRDSSNYFSVKLKNDTTYYIKVAMGEDFDEIVGNYSIKIQATNDITPNTVEEAETLPLDTMLSRSMDGTGDIDCFSITTNNTDTQYMVCVDNINIETDYHDDGKLCIWIVNELDQEISYHIVAMDTRILFNVELEKNTTYYIKLAVGDKYAENVGDYRVCVSSLKIGDVNGDRVINTGDAVTILRQSVGLIQFTLEMNLRADYNLDGLVNTGDAVAVLKRCVGM